MAAEVSCHLTAESTSEDMLRRSQTLNSSSQQLWRLETGFLEMFLAYFYECGQRGTAANSYRDFLYEVLSVHHKYAREIPRVEKNNENANAPGVFTVDAIKREVVSGLDSPCIRPAPDRPSNQVEDVPRLLQPSSTDCSLSGDPNHAGDTVTEDEILATLAKSKEPNEDSFVAGADEDSSSPTVGVLDPAMSLAMPTYSQSEMSAGVEENMLPLPDASERLLPCLICLKWFLPEERLNHHCVPSSIRIEAESGRSEPQTQLTRPPPLEAKPMDAATAAAAAAAATNDNNQCPSCFQQFPDRLQLAFHIRSHPGERLFRCDVCDQRFTHIENLRNHENVHRRSLESPQGVNRKRFKCRHCEKSFDSAYKLNRHGRIHSGERPFACAHCPKRFSRKEHRSRHLQQVHFETTPTPFFPCDYCERFFKSRQAKMFHERTHTSRSEYDADNPML